MHLDSSIPNSELFPQFATKLKSTPSITGLSDSARDVRPGFCFFALRGVSVDGHSFIGEAVRNGAVLVVGEKTADEVKECFGQNDTVIYLTVDDARLELTMCAARAAQHPSRKLLSYAVTGTNGKTTTHWILARILDSLGNKCLRTGTLGAFLGETCFSPETLTTPGVLELNSLLKKAIAEGADSWSTEVSSHALNQSRVGGIDFDGAIFTNLTRDHLDYHGTMEAYCEAKGKLFELLGGSKKSYKQAVIHLATPHQGEIDWGTRMAEIATQSGCRVITFGESAEAAIQIVSFEQLIHGSNITIAERGSDGRSTQYTFFSPLLGAHNVENVVGAYALLTRTGYTREQFFAGLAQMPQVPGRLERIVSEPFQVFVDYAHTPDALERVLVSARTITRGKLWALFGCGGDRDRGKRPQMLAAAQSQADGVIITSDNPRTEDPLLIIQDILENDTANTVRISGIIEPDRRKAIHAALEKLRPTDVLVVAGKGHEDYQIIGKTKHHFSDQEEIRAWIAQQPLNHNNSASEAKIVANHS